MIRKLFWGAAGALVLGAVVFGTEVFSYISTGCRRVTHTVKDAVPVGFEIDRARTMIRKIEPDIRKSMEAIAREEAETERLKKEITKREADLRKTRADVLRLKDDLASGRKDFVYAGRSYSADQVKTDLSARFANYKTRETTAEHLNQVLKAREAGLVAAQQKLVEMQQAKRQLELDVENLEARRKMVEVAQAAGDFKFDDSQLARTRELVSDLNARVDVMAKLAHAHTAQGEIPLQAADDENIVDSVAKYFERDKATLAEASSKSDVK
jgi:predicted  nucleic acid-binding Zn-ribbon protein